MLPVAPSLLDERLEEGGVLPHLRVPQDAERKAPGWILEPLDQPVLRPGDLPEARADAAEALMVVGLDWDTLAEQPAEPAVRRDPHVVVGELAGRVLVLVVSDDLRQVLHVVAAKRNVQDLRPAAYGQHRHVPFQRSPQQRE